MAAGPKKKLKAVSVEDELKLLRFYAGKLQGICATFRFPIKVASSAITFLKRFYLAHSVLDYDPKDIFLTAIYLACKVGCAPLPQRRKNLFARIFLISCCVGAGGKHIYDKTKN